MASQTEENKKRDKESKRQQKETIKWYFKRIKYKNNTQQNSFFAC